MALLHHLVDGRHLAVFARRLSPASPSISRVVEAAARRPLVAAALVALAARLLTAVVSFVVHDGAFADDERSLLDLARFLADDGEPSEWYAGFDKSPFPALSAFVVPLSWLMRVLGPSRLLGQLLAVSFGVVTVVLVTWLAMRIVDRAWAVAAGLIAALLPTQVLWSSLALRESMIWATLALIAASLTAAATERSWRLGSLVGVAVGIAALARLRPLTAVIAVWAIVGSLAVLARTLPRSMSIAVALAALLAPVTGGLGIAGIPYVVEERGHSGEARSVLAAEADSGFVDLETIDPDSVVTPTTVEIDRPDGAPNRRSAFDVVTDDGHTIRVVWDAQGRLRRVHTGVGDSVRDLPRGIAAVVARPLPWESSGEVPVGVVAIESLTWSALLLAAAIGAAVGRRRGDVLAFPVLLALGVLGAAALTEGNLGTAVRHRAQTSWALVLLAIVGVSSFFRSETRST